MYKQPAIVSKLNSLDKNLGGIQVSWEEGGVRKTYAVGENSVNDDQSIRPLNATPDKDVWKALLFSTFPLFDSEEPNIVVGCPASYYQEFERKIRLISGTPIRISWIYEIESGRVIADEKTYIPNIKVAPEAAGHALGFTKVLGRDVHVLSIGFGTVEIVATTGTNRVRKETLFSDNYGLSQASAPFRNELKILGFDNPKIGHNQSHYWDQILVAAMGNAENFRYKLLRDDNEGSLEPIPFEEVNQAANKVLRKYAKELCSKLNDYFKSVRTDGTIYLTGGGIIYKPVQSQLMSFLQNIGRKVEFVSPSSATVTAAHGYKVLAAEQFKGKQAWGIDIGNHSLIIRENEFPLFEEYKPKDRDLSDDCYIN